MRLMSSDYYLKKPRSSKNPAHFLIVFTCSKPADPNLFILWKAP